MVQNKTVRMLVVVMGLTAGIFPVSAWAGWFDFGGKNKGESEPSSNAVKRLHLAIADKAAEKDLLQTTGAKHVLVQEKQVLMLALVDVDAELAKAFGIKPDKNYRYDATAMTLSEVPDTAAAGAKAPQWKQKLDSESDAKKFAALAAAKQATQEDLMVLIRLVREKEAAVGRVEALLRDKFSMSRDRNYWYDPKAMRLYEIVPPSRNGTVQ